MATFTNTPKNKVSWQAPATVAGTTSHFLNIGSGFNLLIGSGYKLVIGTSPKGATPWTTQAHNKLNFQAPVVAPTRADTPWTKQSRNKVTF